MLKNFKNQIQAVGIIVLFLAFSLLSSCACETNGTTATSPVSSFTITNQTFSVDENVPDGGTLVGIVNTSDNDSDNNQITSFTITEGNISNSFIIASNGQLTAASNIDYGVTSSYNLIVEVVDTTGITISAIITVNVNDLVDEWSVRYFSNNTTNDRTAEATNLASTPITALSNKMFVWLDASVFSLLNLNTNGRLTNWVDRNSFRIMETNTNISVSVTTNTSAEVVDGELVGFTNISNNSATVIVLSLTSEVSATPKSDLANNDSLSVYAPGESSGYVTVDYQGNDRVGFQIDTTSMGASDRVRAFYLVTSLESGNNGGHVPLGYSTLSSSNRFFSKSNGISFYVTGGEDRDGGNGVGDLVLGDSTWHRNRSFSVPSSTHLISRTNLNISESDLNGVLGTFPISGNQGGEQRIREIIIFNDTVSEIEHSNVVRYLLEKWNIPREPVTNLYSYYSPRSDNVLQNAIDSNFNTYFYAENSYQDQFVSNRILFELTYYPSVLNPVPLSNFVNGVSTGKNSLFLKMGNNAYIDPIKAPFKVEVLRINNSEWTTISNIAANGNDASKQSYFFISNSSNDYVGYRLVATGKTSSSTWFSIDEFFPSFISMSNPIILTFTNTLLNKVYLNNINNRAIFATGFTNYLYFDQDVYGLEASDFTMTSGTVLSVKPISGNSNYAVIARPYGYHGTNTNHSNRIEDMNILVTLGQEAVTNMFGRRNGFGGISLTYVPYNHLPKSSFPTSSGGSGTPTLVDLDEDGDLDLVQGWPRGWFTFHRNDGDASIPSSLSFQGGTNNPLDGFTVMLFSTLIPSSAPAFVDLDGDGDLDMMSGAREGHFRYYRNNGDRTFSFIGGPNDPLNGVDIGEGSIRSFPDFGDMDGDGDMDMITGNAKGRFLYFRNDGNTTNPSFSPPQWGNDSPFSVNGFIDIGDHSVPTFVDFDGDGDLDMVSGRGVGGLAFFHNIGDASNPNYREEYNTNNPLNGVNVNLNSYVTDSRGYRHFASSYIPSFGDIDADGDLDLVVGVTYVSGIIGLGGILTGHHNALFLNVSGVYRRAEIVIP